MPRHREASQINLKGFIMSIFDKQNRWLSPDDLEAEYGFSKSWQGKARMTSNPSSIPFSKIGGKYIRYDRYQIDRWLEEHQIQGGVA